MISVCSAVFVGVLLLGINAAVGDAPGYDPPGTGISPTFTGLTVGDDVSVGKTLAAGDITTGSVTASGDLRVDGSISTSEGAGWPSLSIDDNVVVSGFFEVEGQFRIKNDFLNPYFIMGKSGLESAPVEIKDDLEVMGDVQLGTGSMFGSVYRVKSSLSGALVHMDSCHSDDILLSCGGYSSIGLKSVYPTETSCAVLSTSTSTIYAYLTCLDPEGIRTGENPS